MKHSLSISNTEPMLFDQCRFPFINELSNIQLSFSYLRAIDRNVFLGMVSNTSLCQPPSKKLVIKFINGNYCLDGHLLLAQYGYAPKCYGMMSLGYGEWKMIVMEYIDGECASMYDQRLTKENKEQELEAIEMLHKFGYVNGDLRDINIMFTESWNGKPEKLFIIDFDWCSQRNELYHWNMNPDIPWHPDANFGQPMKPEHDMHFHHLRYQHLVADLLSVESEQVDE